MIVSAAEHALIEPNQKRVDSGELHETPYSGISLIVLGGNSEHVEFIALTLQYAHSLVIGVLEHRSAATVTDTCTVWPYERTDRL